MEKIDTLCLLLLFPLMIDDFYFIFKCTPLHIFIILDTCAQKKHPPLLNNYAILKRDYDWLKVIVHIYKINDM